MIKPPQKNECLPKCEGLLEASGHAANFGQVVVTEGDVLSIDEPSPAVDGSWRRVVLMPVINGTAAQTEHMDKVRGFRFRVRCDFNPPQLEDGVTFEDIGLNMEAFLEGLHQKVYEVLHLTQLSLSKAEQLYKIKRIRAPGNMHRDPDKGYRYMMAEFLTVLGPTS